MNNSKACGVYFENVSVIRSRKEILTDVNATVPLGGATIIIGPNGAGKTTLLRCLLGEIAYSGKIVFQDARHKPVTPHLAYVPQLLQADGHMPLRVYEFLAMSRTQRPLWLGCSRQNRKQCRELLALVEAEKLENRRLGELSGGEMRRVLLASALGRQPGVLALDEPEAGVDYKGERLFWQLLDQTRREFGFTMIMVSHNLPLAAHYATHVICIKGGVLAQGKPSQTLSAQNLQELFGVPIHLYPQQCEMPEPHCPDCGARGNLPHPWRDTGKVANDS